MGLLQDADEAMKLAQREAEMKQAAQRAAQEAADAAKKDALQHEENQQQGML